MMFLLAAGCAVTPENAPQAAAPRLEIAGIEIRNELAYPVSEVRVLVSATGEFVTCSQVMGGTACQTSFPLRSYRGNAMRVTWVEHGEPQVLDDFVLKAPASSPVLEQDSVVPFESEGQGIAIDAQTGLLWSIQRKTGEVLVSRLP